MNILFVTPTPPFPPRDGGQVMMANLARGLSARHAVTLATLTAFPNPNAPQPYFQNAYLFSQRVAPRWRKWAYSFFDALPLWARVHVSAELRAALPEIVARENIQVVHLDTGAMSQYLDVLSLVPTVAAPHDALTPQLQDRARHASDWRMRLLMRAQVPKMRNFETRCYPRATRVCVVTERERDALLTLAPEMQVRVIPNGVDTEFFAPQEVASVPLTIGFLGAMDYSPNQAAVLYFAQTILPQIVRDLPDVTFTVIGRNPPAEIRALAQNPRLRITGTVDDVRPWVAAQRIMVAPILESGGMKFKVLETLAMGKALVATPPAAEGMTVRDGTELLLVRDANQFANACVKLLCDDTLRGALGKNARGWAAAHGWENTVAQYEALYQEAVNAFAMR